MGTLAAVAGPAARSAVFGGILWLFIGAGFLLLGAAVAGIEKRSYGKSLVSAFFGGVAWAIVAKILWHLPFIGIGLASLGGFFVSVLVTQSIFGTTFGKALVAAIICWVLCAVLAGGAWLILVVLLGMVLL